jgi:hypothetical protein
VVVEAGVLAGDDRANAYETCADGVARIWVGRLLMKSVAASTPRPATATTGKVAPAATMPVISPVRTSAAKKEWLLKRRDTRKN